MTPSGPGRVVLGLGGTIDYEIRWDELLLQQLAFEHRMRREECDSTLPIIDERSLIAVILGFARERHGGERFVQSPEIIEEFAARHDKIITLGGTCVRAALIMRTLGMRSTVHLVSVDDEFRQLYPPDCDYISSATHDGMYPHLIVQLPERGCIKLIDGDIPIEGPNRLIFVNDPPHVQMGLSSDLEESVRTAQLVLVSGFNAMNDIDLLNERLTELRSTLKVRPAAATVMYEDAGFHSPRLQTSVREHIAPMVDVYSMNEDELQTHLGRTVDLLNVDSVAHALDDARALIPGPTLVIHTRHWALASGHGAARLAPGLRGGISAATARYVYGDRVTAARVAAITQINPPVAHQRFAESITRAGSEPITSVPAYSISVEHPTTIGLGDCFVGGFLAALAASPNEGHNPA
ncbi:ADP-dependent glucokinase/phosphofructokinase [Rathayibacter soli]|uniref:ADP-dependent glucokinase/phosphofructokinase n=1 Tax=Rathayibacter soli TaxID=3144168 RepID=UPI0027E42D00|nr:ADP-dependent glucokinase/phosphofructokinase [Glaciibacter superstes]